MTVIDASDVFITLRQYQDAIRYMRTQDVRKYKKALEKDTRIYQDVITLLNENSN